MPKIGNIFTESYFFFNIFLKISTYNLHFLKICLIFAPSKLGLTGFDSGMGLCVSMQ